MIEQRSQLRTLELELENRNTELNHIKANSGTNQPLTEGVLVDAEMPPWREPTPCFDVWANTEGCDILINQRSISDGSEWFDGQTGISNGKL